MIDDYKRLLKALVLTQAYLETLDDVKEISTFYKHSNKQKIDNLSNELEKALGLEFIKVYNRDEKSFQLVIESMHTIARWVSETSMEDLYSLSEAIKKDELKFIEK